MLWFRVNSLPHQHDDMHISVTGFIAKIMKNAKCIEKSLCAQNMPVLELSLANVPYTFQLL